MKKNAMLGLAIIMTGAVSSAALAKPPAVPETPAAVDELVYARPFKLTDGYEFHWRKEKPVISEGLIVVLKVNPDLVYPRQTAELVLYIGDQTAERVNVGYPSGIVVAIVPGNAEKLDLSKTPIWFGTPELPERCDAAMIKAERKKADNAGIKPLDAKSVSSATKVGGERLEVKDRYELRRTIADVIEKHSPDEADLIKALRVPRDEP